MSGLHCVVTVLLHTGWKGNVLGLSDKHTAGGLWHYALAPEALGYILFALRDAEARKALCNKPLSSVQLAARLLETQLACLSGFRSV